MRIQEFRRVGAGIAGGRLQSRVRDLKADEPVPAGAEEAPKGSTTHEWTDVQVTTSPTPKDLPVEVVQVSVPADLVGGPVELVKKHEVTPTEAAILSGSEQTPAASPPRK